MLHEDLEARVGCAVLVMDQFSYGERRQHPPGHRQDYRFRYINGIQLHVIGDSLMGWMVWDVMRGIDLLWHGHGFAICLPDLRRTGETSPDDSQGRQSSITALSATAWMVGETLLGSRLRDLRSLLGHLRFHGIGRGCEGYPELRGIAAQAGFRKSHDIRILCSSLGNPLEDLIGTFFTSGSVRI